MPWFEVHTSEVVRGKYDIQAEDSAMAKMLFLQGMATVPSLYEAEDCEIIDVKEVDNTPG